MLTFTINLFAIQTLDRFLEQIQKILEISCRPFDIAQSFSWFINPYLHGFAGERNRTIRGPRLIYEPLENATQTRLGIVQNSRRDVVAGATQCHMPS